MPGTQLPSGMVTPLHGRTTSGSRPLSSQSDTTGSSHRCLSSLTVKPLALPAIAAHSLFPVALGQSQSHLTLPVFAAQGLSLWQ